MRLPDLYRTARDRRTASFMLMLLRMVVGAIFISHGWQKLCDVPGTIVAFRALGIPVPAIAAYVAITAEFFGGLGLLLGALTPVAALGPAFAMAFAICFAQGGAGLLAASNGWEYPLILLLICLYLATHGAGAYSVDSLFLADQPRRFRRRHRHVAASS